MELLRHGFRIFNGPEFGKGCQSVVKRFFAHIVAFPKNRQKAVFHGAVGLAQCVNNHQRPLSLSDV